MQRAQIAFLIAAISLLGANAEAQDGPRPFTAAQAAQCYVILERLAMAADESHRDGMLVTTMYFRGWLEGRMSRAERRSLLRKVVKTPPSNPEDAAFECEGLYQEALWRELRGDLPITHPELKP